MFDIDLKKHRFAYFRLLLIIYSFILMSDGIWAGQNLWFFELCIFLISTVSGFFIGRGYENYYYQRYGQIEYPTKEKFNGVAWLISAVFAFLFYLILNHKEIPVRLAYSISRGLSFYIFIKLGFYINDKSVKKSGTIFGLLPIISISLILFLLDKKLYANISVLTFIIYVVVTLFHYTPLTGFIKKAFANRKEKGLINYILKFTLKIWCKIRLGYGKLTEFAVNIFKVFLPGATIKKRLVRILRKIYKFFWREKETRYKKYDDYTDEIFSLYTENDQSGRIEYSIRQLRKLKDPVKKIRYSYGLVMSRLFEKKVGLKYYDTVEAIRKKSEVIEGLSKDLNPLSDIYENTRYGSSDVVDMTAEEAAILAMSADTVITESTWHPKEYVNLDTGYK